MYVFLRVLSHFKSFLPFTTTQINHSPQPWRHFSQIFSLSLSPFLSLRLYPRFKTFERVRLRLNRVVHPSDVFLARGRLELVAQA
uniref:Uncharacterized protein n=1 Tax=Vespula pensylvanica TaxID=30213 RepID=A0A834UEH0_VESPE|nr:hypothetical protein H0235_002959 [Vespula pensylvanica]